MKRTLSTAAITLPVVVLLGALAVASGASGPVAAANALHDALAAGDAARVQSLLDDLGRLPRAERV